MIYQNLKNFLFTSKIDIQRSFWLQYSYSCSYHNQNLQHFSNVICRIGNLFREFHFKIVIIDPKNLNTSILKANKTFFKIFGPPCWIRHLEF